MYITYNMPNNNLKIITFVLTEVCTRLGRVLQLAA
jgi:hypothetical protein